MIGFIFAILLLIVALVFTLISMSILEEKGERSSVIYMPLGTMLCTIIGIAVICYNDSPKAIDVYRGKTTLEITYRDSIPVDSTVVYKKK